MHMKDACCIIVKLKGTIVLVGLRVRPFIHFAFLTIVAAYKGVLPHSLCTLQSALPLYHSNLKCGDVF